METTIPSAEDQQRERAVFDDDEDDGYTEGDDSDLDDDDSDPDDDPRRPPQPPPQQPQPPTDPSPTAATDPTSAIANATPAAVSPFPIVPAPQNGAVPLLTSSSAPEIKIEERRALVPFDDSRRLFQRLWTDDDEIKILRGFLEFTTQRGTTFASHQYDTGPFYEQIKRELQLDFTKNQLIEKLRRLKKKFRNAATKVAAGKEFVFKSPHDQATFEISRKIWSVGLKRSRESDDDDLAATTPAAEAVNVDAFGTAERRLERSRRRIRRRMDEATVDVPIAGSATAAEDSVKTILAPPSCILAPTLIEETVKSCLGPLFKELLNSAVRAPNGPGLSIGAGGLPLNQLLPLSFSGISVNPPGSTVGGADEKWRKQQILELEVYLKRIELLQEQIKSTLEELKSSPGS